MTLLKVFDETGELQARFEDHGEIAERLGEAGVLLERWEASRPLAEDADQEAILAAYAPEVERLKTRYGFASADVIALTPDHPDRGVLRAKFLDEHTHSDFEVRFFVRGQGLFYIHRPGVVYGVLCQAGDLISVPAQTPHWFDMGAAPDFQCIRLFTTPEGWVAEYTGDPIAKRFPRLEGFA